MIKNNHDNRYFNESYIPKVFEELSIGNHTMRTLKKLSVIYLFLFANIIISAQTPSFPGAEGYGKYSLGGRGGNIHFVVNLNDNGPGSLREACSATGPRTVIFRVGGIIQLDSSITIRDPFITIAGQSAPGDGICLKHSGASGFGNSLMHVSTHDVIIRYLKLRRGPSAEGECCGDCLSLSNNTTPVYNIIADHLSLSWSTDEALSSWYEAHDISVQNCIIAEPLYFSTHLEDTIQGHSKGAFFGDYSTNITFYRNIITHSADRNPYCVTTHEGFIAKFQVINNLIYNWVYFGAKFGSTSGLSKADFIGNYLKPGPDTRTTRFELLFSENADANTKVYVEDNIGHHRLSSNNPSTEWDIAGVGMTNPAPTNYRSLSRFTADLSLPILPVMVVYDSLLQNVGANRRLDDNGEWIMNQDSVDIRIMNDIKTEGPSTGNILANGKFYYGLIDSPAQVGGWPAYKTSIPYPDNDNDGMSDIWETANGFNSSDASDRNNDFDNDGYTNLEEFLNSTNPKSNITSLSNLKSDIAYISPNPTTGIVYLFVESKWAIISIQGVLLASGKGSMIDLTNYQNGIYFLKLDGTIKRIVKVG